MSSVIDPSANSKKNKYEYIKSICLRCLSEMQKKTCYNYVFTIDDLIILTLQAFWNHEFLVSAVAIARRCSHLHVEFIIHDDAVVVAC